MQRLLLPTINFDRCLQLFLLVSPILWLPGMTQNGLQFLLFNYGGVILLSLALFLGVRRRADNPVLPLILICNTILAVILNPRGYPLGFIALIAGVSLYYSIILGVKRIKGVVLILLIMSLINVVFALCQKFGLYLVYDPGNTYALNPSFHISHTSMPGLMGRNYHLAYSLVIISPLGFILNKKIGWISICIAGVFVFLIESYACRFAFAVMLLILLSSRVNKKGIIVLLILSAITLTVLKGETIVNKLNTRAKSYEYIIKECMINVFIGRGIGSFDLEELQRRGIIKLASSFNQYLRTMFEIGVVPFLFLAWSLVRYFRSFKRKNIYFLASLGAMAIYPLFHEVLRFARFDILIITIIALFEVDCINKREQLQEEVL